VVELNEEKQRNYNKEYENDKKRDKRYTVRVPLYKAKILDEKLKKDNKTYSSIALEAIEKYLKKN
jgi:predicted DNA-binding protein